MMNSNSILISPNQVSIVSTDLFYTHVGESSVVDPVARTVKKVINSEDFIRKVSSRMYPDTSSKLLPPNCRYHKSLPNNRSIVVIEEQPQMRTILTSNQVSRDIEALKKTGAWEQYGYKGLENTKYGLGDGSSFKFTLSFPYIVYIMSFNGNDLCNMTIYFRLSPITTLNDYLLLAPLHNIPQDQRICLGSWRDSKTISGSVSEEVEKVITTFWSGVFNMDYTNNCLKYSDVYELSNYFVWQYFSKTNPMFIFKVKWHQWNSNLITEVKRLQSILGVGTNTVPFSFPALCDVLLSPTLVAEEEKSPDVKFPLFENFVESIHLGNGSLSIGDDIVYLGKKYYITDFLGNVNYSNSPSYIVFTDEEGKKDSLKLDSNTKTELNSVFATTKESKTIKLPACGVTINIGDIVEFTVDETFKGYRKVENIRLGLDKRNHIRLGNDYYFADSLKVKILDLSKGIELPNGTTIIIGNTYSFLVDIGTSLPIKRIFDVKVEEYIVQSDKLAIKIRYLEGGRLEIHDIHNLSNLGNIIDFSKLEIVEYKEKVLRLGFNLLDFKKSIFEKAYIDTNNLDLYVKYTRAASENYGTYPIQQYLSQNFPPSINDILIENRQRLFIPSFEFNIDFKIGDNVVVADWSNPQEILKVRTIQGFTFDESTYLLNIIVNDPITNTSKVVPYVNLDLRLVKVGSVRKVSIKQSSYEIGDQIRAMSRGIADFPMKDTVSIVAFLIDTGIEPMVLCSNLATIWFSDLRKHFAKVPGKNITIDPSTFKKFTTSPGNMVILGRDSSCPCFILEYTKSPQDVEIMEQEKLFRPRLIDPQKGGSVCSAEGSLTYHLPYGIPIPRLSQAEYMSKKLQKCYMNAHGSYIKNKNSQYGIRATKFMN